MPAYILHFAFGKIQRTEVYNDPEDARRSCARYNEALGAGNALPYDRSYDACVILIYAANLDVIYRVQEWIYDRAETLMNATWFDPHGNPLAAIREQESPSFIRRRNESWNKIVRVLNGATFELDDSFQKGLCITPAPRAIDATLS